MERFDFVSGLLRVDFGNWQIFRFLSGLPHTRHGIYFHSVSFSSGTVATKYKIATRDRRRWSLSKDQQKRWPFDEILYYLWRFQKEQLFLCRNYWSKSSTPKNTIDGCVIIAHRVHFHRSQIRLSYCGIISPFIPCEDRLMDDDPSTGWSPRSSVSGNPLWQPVPLAIIFYLSANHTGWSLFALIVLFKSDICGCRSLCGWANSSGLSFTDWEWVNEVAEVSFGRKIKCNHSKKNKKRKRFSQNNRKNGLWFSHNTFEDIV